MMTTEKTDKTEKSEKPDKKAAALKKKAAPKKDADGAEDVKKAPAKKTSKKKDADEGATVRRQTAESRSTQEAGSIAPPTTHLVDAFAKLRSAGKKRIIAPPPELQKHVETPRQPKPAAAPQSAAPAPVPAPAAPVAAPVPAAAAPAKPAAAAPAKPAAAKPGEPKATYSMQPPAAAPAKPAAPGAPAPAKPAVLRPGSTAPAAPAPAKPGSPAAKPPMPEPKATYKLDTPTVRPGAPRPGAHPPMRPGAPMGPKPAAPRPAARPDHAPAAPKPAAPQAKPEVQLKTLEVSTLITVRELAEKMSIRPNELIKKLMLQGVFVTINQRLDSETAILVAQDYGYALTVKALHMEDELAGAAKTEEKPEDLKPRPAVVTVMGHVDHGKTKLLDAIRKTDVVSGEAGGITQHIGAYKVKVPRGEVVFLDTPGHEAFTAMRSRGAKVTDIVILVVSAADGVQPQTIEAIDHAKEAKVPIIVAVNKIDLPGADPQRIRQDLSNRGLVPEEWGGKNIYVDISAKKVVNIDKLLDMVLLQAEMLELKANPKRAATGTVVEAKLDAKRGAVATVLIQNGTLSVGDPFVVGLAGGKVKAIVTDKGDRVKSAGPSTPVEIMGLSGNIPQAGDTFTVVESERTSKEITEKRNRVHREEALAHKQHVSLLTLKGGLRKELPVILKADVSGSLEVLKDSLEKLSNKDITVRVIHSGLGGANESDVVLASASDAVILMFHVDSDSRAKETAEKQGVEIWQYDIIYNLTADVKAALEGLLEPEEVEVSVGKVEVREEFVVRHGRIAGCFVQDGKVLRGAKVKVFRAGQHIGDDRVESLKRFKDDAKEVEKGLECGLSLAGTSGWKKGDLLEVIVKEKRVRRLDSGGQA